MTCKPVLLLLFLKDKSNKSIRIEWIIVYLLRILYLFLSVFIITAYLLHINKLS